MSGADKAKYAIVSVLMALQVVYALAITQPSHFSVDEGVYHMMARAMAQDGSLAVWNGYGETPSDELVYALLREDLRDGAAPRLVPQYPAIYAFLAAPFYMVDGYKGLFWINILAFFGTVWATAAIARRLYADRSVALNAALFLILGTFTWEYAQGAWPHSLSMFMVAAAVLAGLVALDRKSPGQATVWAAVAGLVVGIGAGIRYDAILVAPALALPFLFGSPPRFRPLIGLAAGLVPGLLLLAITNEAKFGIFSPFTYGMDSQGGPDSIRGYIPMVVAGGAAVVMAWLATREPVRRLYAGRPLWIAAAGIAVVALILLVPQTRALSWRLMQGALELVVDLRFRPGIEEWGVSRTPTGGLVYGQWLKKALLQSCPWLVLLVIPAAGWLRRRDGRTAVLFLVIGAFITFYSYHRWHGGMSLNMRYFLPILPLAAILAADAWKTLSSGIPDGWRKTAVTFGLLTALLWSFLLLKDPELTVEPVLLSTPLAIAAALAAALILRAVSTARLRTAIGGAGLTLAAVGLAWAFSAAFAYDLLRTSASRAVNYKIGAEVRTIVEPDAIVFSRYANRVSVLIDDGVRLAFPRNDDFADFRRLMDIHLSQGRPVYLAFNGEYRAWLEADKLLEGLEVEELYEQGDVWLARIR